MESSLLQSLLRDLPIFSTVDEVAVVLATPTHLVQRWLRAGDVPGWKIGAGWIILTRELQEHLERARVDIPAHEPATPIEQMLGNALGQLPTHLSVRDVAELFGIATTTAYTWLQEGQLPGYRLPGGWLVLREEVIEYLTALREQRPVRRDVLGELYERAPTRLRPGDIGALLGLSGKSVWGLLRTGKVPAYAIGKDTHYRFALAEELLQWQRTCANSALTNLGETCETEDQDASPAEQ